MTDKSKSRGTFFEDFRVGDVLNHHWGRTLNAGDNSMFTTLTLHFNPLYLNAEFAKEQGYDDIVVNPCLVFGTVFGMSVEDCSEKGGAFLGIEDLEFLEPVYPGDTLTARSIVTDKRQPGSRKTHGIVTWNTEGFRAGRKVIGFQRSNLVLRRELAA